MNWCTVFVFSVNIAPFCLQTFELTFRWTDAQDPAESVGTIRTHIVEHITV